MNVPLFLNGEPIDTLLLTVTGTRTSVEITMPRNDNGLFRGVLCCRKGEIPLGILEPHEDQLILRRPLLTEEIDRLGGAVSGEIRMSYSFQQTQWQPLGQTPFFTSADSGIRLKERSSLLWRREGNLKFLAFPFQSGKPFPMPDLFCFARIFTIRNCNYAVFAFNDQDFPVMVTKLENTGKGKNASTTSCTFML